MSIAEKLTTIAENVPKVYEAGKTAEWNRFWDNLQDYGNRKGYNYAFSWWADEAFYPKYDIIPEQQVNSIATTGIFAYSKISNIKKRLEDCGVVFSTSKLNTMQSIFIGCLTEELPDLDLSYVTWGCKYCWQNCKNLRSLTLNDVQAKNVFDSAFAGCISLSEFYITGEIGRDFNVSSAPLDLPSAKRILTHLVNYAGTENEFTYSVKFSSDVWDLLNADGATAPDSMTWAEYVDSKCWNT